MGAIGGGKIAQLDDAVSEEITKAIGAAGERSPMRKLGLALSLLHLLETDEVNGWQTLEQYDPEARAVLGMRRASLRRVADRMLEHAAVKRGLAAARRDALRKVLGSDHARQIAAYAEYLRSDAFHDPLDALSERERADRIKTELAKLTTLDPGVAQETAVALAGIEAVRRPAAVLDNRFRKRASSGGGPAELEAIDRVLQVYADLPDLPVAPSQVKEAITTAKRGKKAIGAGTKLHTLLRDVGTRRRIASRLQRAMSHRSYYAMLKDPQAVEKIAKELEATNEPETAALLRRMGQTTLAGRGFATFTSLLALAGIVTTWPPTKSWQDMLSFASASLSITSSLRHTSKFVLKDLPRLGMALLGADFKVVRVAHGGVEAAKLAGAAKFIRLARFLGVVGDILILPVTISNLVDEVKNKDPVGVWTSAVAATSGLVGLCASIAAFTGATGVGAPLAAIAAVVGLAAACVNWLAGESAMTGQVRRDLETLGISTEEDRVVDSYTRKRGRKVQHAGDLFFSHPTTVRRSKAEIRSLARTASPRRKAHLINHYMDQNTDQAEETLIYQVLMDTPVETGAFLELASELDTKVLADELENQQQNAQVLRRLERAYRYTKAQPGRELSDYVGELLRQRRFAPVKAWLREADHGVFHRIPPEMIKGWTEQLLEHMRARPQTFAGDDERTIISFYARASRSQVSALREEFSYMTRLRARLTEWGRIRLPILMVR